MLTRLIVALYVWLLEIALWMLLAVAGVVGYHVMVPMMKKAGAIPTYEFTWQIVGALVFPIIAFLLMAVVVGPLLILVDIRSTVRTIEKRLERRTLVDEVPSFLQRKEPYF